jgi:hypothetical protein
MEDLNIYKMKLHESATIVIDSNPVKIVKAPGGWIYFFESQTPVFVPSVKQKKSFVGGFGLLKDIFNAK